jgi:hypothetical protein
MIDSILRKNISNKEFQLKFRKIESFNEFKKIESFNEFKKIES